MGDKKKKKKKKKENERRRTLWDTCTKFQKIKIIYIEAVHLVYHHHHYYHNQSYY